ncbi:MAG: lysophospholipid acyltransferase family protein [Tepidisphaeraceae bacterium]
MSAPASWPPGTLYPTKFYKLMRGIGALVARIIFDTKVRGAEHVPAEGGVLVVSNHESYLDPVALGFPVKRPFAFLADAYLFKFKPFGWMIRNLNAFPVGGGGELGAMRETIRLLKEGWALTIFPEGMRSPDGTLQPVQAGAALVIRRTDVPIVPAVIVGAYAAWPRHRVLPTFGKVRVLFGPPMQLSHLNSKQIVETLTETFIRMRREAEAWAAELETCRGRS